MKFNGLVMLGKSIVGKIIKSNFNGFPVDFPHKTNIPLVIAVVWWLRFARPAGDFEFAARSRLAIFVGDPSVCPKGHQETRVFLKTIEHLFQPKFGFLKPSIVYIYIILLDWCRLLDRPFVSSMTVMTLYPQHNFSLENTNTEKTSISMSTVWWCVLFHGGTPSHHPFVHGIFPWKSTIQQRAGGTPMTQETIYVFYVCNPVMSVLGSTLAPSDLSWLKLFRVGKSSDSHP